MTDWSLLRDYLDTGSQAAFTKLMDRRMKLVYWTCRRGLYDDQMAEDATQAVFLLLVRKAPTFNRSVSISSWLFQTARYVSCDMRRSEACRKQYEEEAAQMRNDRTETDDWARVEPRLNEAVATLSDTDREAVLLRYFEGLSLREVADEIGATEEAARKRVARAVDRMRRFLSKKEVPVTSLALAALLAQHSAKAVPAQVQAAALSAVGRAMAGRTPAHISPLLAKGAYLIMQTTKVKTILAVAALGVLLVGGIAGWKIYRAHGATQHAEGFIDRTASLPAGDAAAADRRAIAGQLRQIVEGFDQHNISALKADIAPDGTFDLRPGSQIGSTTRNLDDLQASLSTHPDMRILATLVSTDVQGDRATTHVLSDASTTTVPGDGEEVGKQIRSRQMTIQHWEKLGGRWQLKDWYVER